MDQYCIYDHPSDFPDSFVVRRLRVLPGKIDFHEASFASTLDDARKLVPKGLVCVPRHDSDDPVIVETWL